MFKINGVAYPCCTSVTMGIIGGKWKSVILFNLIERPLRYSELRKAISVVTERTLSLQLKKLEEDGMIKRTVVSEKPTLNVEYSLTEFGRTIIPLIEAIAQWGYSAVEQLSENDDWREGYEAYINSKN